MSTLNSISTQFAKIAGQKIAFRSFGTGKVLLLTNRFRGIMDSWDPLFLDSLARKNRVVLFDYPEIGDSEGKFPTDIKEIAKVAVQLTDYLQVQTFNLLGWSLGGQVAQYITFLYPKRVLKTVIIGCNPPGENKIPFDPEFFKRALKPINDLDDETVLFFDPNSKKSKQAAVESHNRISQQLDVGKIPASQELLQRCLAPSKGVREDNDNFRAAYQTLKQPILVIHGDHDISFSVENWFPLLKKAPTLQLIVLPGSGHAPHHQYPLLIASYIESFLTVLT